MKLSLHRYKFLLYLQKTRLSKMKWNILHDIWPKELPKNATWENSSVMLDSSVSMSLAVTVDSIFRSSNSDGFFDTVLTRELVFSSLKKKKIKINCYQNTPPYQSHLPPVTVECSTDFRNYNNIEPYITTKSMTTRKQSV